VDDSNLRFGGIERLYSSRGLERLRRARVCVLGIGGVGSWAAESLARSGVGAISLVDMDDVCVSNVNRQLHALDGVIGRPKAVVMAERLRAINPACQATPIPEFFTAESAERILAGGFDYVIDAIDNVANKCLLIARCRERNIPIVASGGAGGRRNPTVVRIADLAQTTHDALLVQVRKTLRDEHGFPRDAKKSFGVPCVFSPEPAARPFVKGDACEPDPAAGLRLDCESGYGTASFVTGTFGLAAAAHVVNALADIGP